MNIPDLNYRLGWCLLLAVFATWQGTTWQGVAALGQEKPPGKDAADAPTEAELAFFESKIRPVLIKHCYDCHSAEAGAAEGGLRVDSREALLHGGDRGPAVVPGKPAASLLITAVTHVDADLKMPPKQPRLSAGVLADLKTWIRQGAPDPRIEGERAERTDPAWDKSSADDHWAYRSLPLTEDGKFKQPELPALKSETDREWPRRDLDGYILAQLKNHELAPSPDAPPEKLLRRLHFDLVGLPPTPDDSRQFERRIAEAGLDAAMESETDRLLAMPQFGERWGRHWLDVARFGESSGKEANISFPHESGQWISELFPELARHADDLCLIRGMQTDLPNHSQAFIQMHTGSFQFVRPSVGAWTLYGLGTENTNLPGFITLNPPSDNGGAKNYGSAFLPAVYQGTKIGANQIPGFYAALLGIDQEPGPPLRNIETRRLSIREQRAQLDLVRDLNAHKLAKEVHHPEIEGAIESFELAFRMQGEIPELLDLTDEPDAMLKQYGIGPGLPTNRFGRQCLLARRLAEAGVRFIEITPPVGWDHHFRLKEELATSCAATDQPIAALLADLKQRGMLDETLVIWAGEFGRTPHAQSGTGRDHNNHGYTIWMAGGGTKGGIAHGATDELGAQAVEDPVHIHDWHATILHLLGLDHKRLTFNHAGRDFRLTDVYGNVVHDLLQDA